MTRSEELEMLLLKKRKAEAYSENAPLRAGSPEEPLPPDDATTLPAKKDGGKVGPWEAGGMGAAHGFTLRGLDEGIGTIEAVSGQARAAGRAASEFVSPSPAEGYADAGSQVVSKRLRGADGEMREIERRKVNHASLPPDAKANWPSPLKDYRGGRDGTRAILSKAREDQPAPFIAGEIAGDGAMQAALALGTGGLSMTPAAQGGVGAASGFLGSEADGTRGEYGDLAFDTGLGGGLNYGIARGAKAAGPAIKNSRLAKYFTGKVDDAGKRAVEMGDEEAEALWNSAHGKYRGTVADAYRQGVERPEALLPDMPPALAKKWEELVASGKLQTLKEKLFKASLEAAPKSVDVMETALAAVPDKKKVAAEAADQILNNPWSREIKPRVQRYLAPVLGTLAGDTIGSDLARGVVGAGAGYLIGGGREGSSGEAAVGALAGAGMRPALRAMYRMVNSPSVTKVWAGKLGGLLESFPEALGRFGPVLAREGSSPGALMAMDAVLSERYPDYLEMKAKLLGVEKEEGDGQ